MTTDADIIERLARIEVGIANMIEKIDRLTNATALHSDTLTDHETRIAVLETRTGSWKGIVAVVGAIVGALGFGLAVLDRLYG